MAAPVFFGLDLAWSTRNPSGIALARLRHRTRGVWLEETAYPTADYEIVRWIRERAPAAALIAIDAPLIAPNRAGTARDADRALTRVFGRFQAGVYPANRERAARPIAFRRKLERLGFSADPRLPSPRPESGIRRQLEFYPHSSMVALFELPAIVKYKKGSVGARRRGLRRLQRMLGSLGRREPALERSPALRRLLSTPPRTLRGRALKQLEDELDAVFLAYLAAYYWRWGLGRCALFGEVRSGYILTISRGSPTALLSGAALGRGARMEVTTLTATVSAMTPRARAVGIL